MWQGYVLLFPFSVKNINWCPEKNICPTIYLWNEVLLFQRNCHPYLWNTRRRIVLFSFQHSHHLAVKSILLVGLRASFLLSLLSGFHFLPWYAWVNLALCRASHLAWDHFNGNMIRIPKEREKYKAGVFEYEKSHLLSIWRTYFSGMLYALKNVLS